MKKINKKWLIIALCAAVVIAAILFLCLPKQEAQTGENLLKNSGFESVGTDLLPEGWYTDAYAHTGGITDFSVSVGMDGDYSIYICSRAQNDARFAQTVSVQPNSLYLLHGYIKASAKGGLGANLSVEGVYAFSDCVYDTDGEWREVSLYGRTGPDQTSLTVFARLGGYSGESEGEAWFDNVTLERVDSVPEGYWAEDLYASSSAYAEEADVYEDTGLWLILGAAAFYLLLVIWGVHGKMPDKKAIFFCLIFAGIVLRVLIAHLVSGYDVDIGCFIAWAYRMATQGPLGFYEDGYFCDYPPGYLLVLWPIGLIGKWLGTGATEFMVKMPSVIADVCGAGLLYRFAKKQGCGRKAHLAGLYLLNPLVLAAGAAWGQCDGIMTLFLLICVLYALENKWKIALPAYLIAVLMKPQALMFGPLGLGYLIWNLVQNRKSPGQMLKDVGVGLAIMAGVFAAIVLPFGNGQVWWLIELYFSTMSSYAYATVNACNAYFMLGLNWASAADTCSVWAIALTCGAIALPCGLRIREKPKEMGILCGICLMCALLCIILQASLAVWNGCMICLCVGLCLWLLIRSGNCKHLPLLGALTLILLFNCADMMHERYLFPCVMLLCLALILEKDRRILGCLLLISLGGFLNVSCVLSRNIRIGGAEGHLWAPLYGIDSDMTALEIIACLLNFAGCVCLLWTALHLTGKEAVPHLFGEKSAAPAVKNEKKRFDILQDEQGDWLKNHRCDKKDVLIILGCTALYACLAFWHLGSHTAPQTEYVFADPDEQVTFDLGEVRENFRMLYYGGIHYSDSDFTIQVSDDGENWSDPITCEMAIGDLFSWKYAKNEGGSTDARNFSGRYVRLTADNWGLTLFEVLFRDEAGNVLPVSATDSMGNDITALTDEQDTLEGEPGWYNSMYFDEIYHARTAYEHLHGISPYETSHPPLGKVIMSWFIGIFGMTPFGWRFAGTLCGVLMLPAMYLLGKLLFKKRRYAVASMLLLTFDCMHYTQTRLATIDSFVVLFILWSVYFMLRWFFCDFAGKKFGKTLVPLGLSGLFMGLAVASKWTGCYAGVGLAILFFLRMANHFRAMRRMPEKDTRKPLLQNRMILTLLSCLIFFVAVPCVIYYCAYIPYFAPTGGVTVQRVIQAAEGMLSYHSTPGLGMDHPFYSPWYEWPLSITPMYYASDSYEPAGYACTILSFGNPAVWWTGLSSLLLVLYALLRHQLYPALQGGYDEKRHILAPEGQRDVRPALLVISFAAQFLPWMLVPRGTYIYHYFPSVPFIILCSVLCCEYLTEYITKRCRNKKRAGRLCLIGLILFLAIALALFVIYFPYASGVLTGKQYLSKINLLNNLYY